ncbi:hypothetical protein MAPG_07936 [Magnaporthiopsis poae ATCC 64411]|uniref:Uncharacterized protein n=1 Tax=Magnaporthiopsis poae (strain ATCC 64411 / 73-15) TaxID=644358 RepID=A0A0C4E607_MAGP6|nr:hypothetical protein MAPG_07936 [Magnaporthiopsis poae ATCC 64411]
MENKFKVGDKVEGYLGLSPRIWIKYRAIVRAAPAHDGNQWTVETREALRTDIEDLSVVEWEGVVARHITVYSHELKEWTASDGWA